MPITRYLPIIAMDAEPSDGGGGGGGDSQGQDTSVGSGGAEPGAGQSALSQAAGSDGKQPSNADGKPSALSEQGDPKPEFFGVPEKYRVMDGENLNAQATLEKTAQAYNELAKRMGQADGTAPSAPGDYQINMPDGMGEAFDQSDPGFKDFLSEAHQAGYTQKQIDVAMQAFGKTVGKMAQGLVVNDVDECNATLEKVWTDPKDRQANFGKAFRAATSFAGDRFQDIENKFGSDPDFIWLMAQVGETMSEASPPGDESASGETQSMDAVVKDLQSKDPQVRKKAEQAWQAHVARIARQQGEQQ